MVMSLEKDSLLAKVVMAKEEEKREAETVRLQDIPLLLILIPLCLFANLIRLMAVLTMSLVCSIAQTVTLIYILGKR